MTLAAPTMTADLSIGLSIGAVAGALVGLLLLGAAVWWCRRYITGQVRRGRWLWERGVLRVRAVVLPAGPRREIGRRLRTTCAPSSPDSTLSHWRSAGCIRRPTRFTTQC